MKIRTERPANAKQILQAKYFGAKDLREKQHWLYMYTREILDQVYTEEHMREQAKNRAKIL